MSATAMPDPGLADERLVDVLDRLLDRGVALRGELWITVADVDLLYIGADLVIASPERMQRDRAGARGRDGP